MWLAERQAWIILENIACFLEEMMKDPDPEKAQRVTLAMLKMGKLNISELKRAYEEINYFEAR